MVIKREAGASSMDCAGASSMEFGCIKPESRRSEQVASRVVLRKEAGITSVGCAGASSVGFSCTDPASDISEYVRRSVTAVESPRS